MTKYQPTPEVLQAMFKKALEKFASAQMDMKDGLFDDAVSRAYYAVFHAVSAVLAQRGLTFSSHAQLMGAFNREFVKTREFPADTYRKLQQLFEDRQTGDYDWHSQIDEETAKQDLENAAHVIELCREYLEKATGKSFSVK